MYKNLRGFIQQLKSRGELITITDRVSPDREITELTDRQAKAAGGGKALLFENTGTQFPVVTGMMGSMNRITMALGVESLSELTDAIDAISGDMMRPRSSFMDKISLLPSLIKVGGIFPRNISSRGECQQVVHMGEDASLDMLPVLKCWPHDGGRFITLPLVTTVDPDSGAANLGMYRMQIFSPHKAGLHWHLHKTGERHYRRYKELGRDRMPVSIVLGGDPVYIYSATAPLPDGISEYLLAGFIRKRPVSLVKCLTNDLRVPSDADIIIEGYVDLSEEKVVEGPFGDHTGFYSLEDHYPTLHVTAITHRKDAIYPATIVGVPPQEDLYFSAATENIFLSPIRTVMAPEIRHMWLPGEGVAHNIAILDIKKDYIGQPFKVASTMWGAGQMMFNKFIILTSSGANPQDLEQLARAFSTVEVPRDIFLSKGPADVLDHASSELGLGGKMAIDASQKEGAEVVEISIPKDIVEVDGLLGYSLEAIKHGFPLLILYIDPTSSYQDLITEFLDKNPAKGVKFIVTMDVSFQGASLSDHLWYGSSNIDPMRDIVIQGDVVYLDGRAKHLGQNGFNRRWPNVVVMDDETIANIDKRWAAIMGSEEFIPSPSLKYRKFLLSDGADYKSDK